MVPPSSPFSILSSACISSTERHCRPAPRGWPLLRSPYCPVQWPSAPRHVGIPAFAKLHGMAASCFPMKKNKQFYFTSATIEGPPQIPKFARPWGLSLAPVWALQALLAATVGDRRRSCELHSCSPPAGSMTKASDVVVDLGAAACCVKH